MSLFCFRMNHRGMIGIVLLLFSVVHCWEHVTVATGSVTDLSCAIVDGHPAMAYVLNGELVFTRSSDVDGWGWGLPASLGSVGARSPATRTGESVTLLDIEARPAVAFYDLTNRVWKFSRASDAKGTSWGTAQTILTHGTASFAVNGNGNLAVAFINYTSDWHDIYFLQARDADGLTWDAAKIIDREEVISSPMLAFVNGHPAVTYTYYSRYNGEGFRYVRAMDANGLSWEHGLSWDWGRTIVRADAIVSASFSIVGGNPALAYCAHKDAHFDLKFIRSNDSDGLAWGGQNLVNTIVSVSDGDWIVYPMLAEVQGKPAIAYQTYNSVFLNLIQASNVDGTIWEPPIVFGPLGLGVYRQSLVLIHGGPALAYFDVSNNNLQFSFVAPPTPSPTPPEPGAAHVFSVERRRQFARSPSLAIVDGFPAVAYTSKSYELKFIRAKNADGTTWEDASVVDGSEGGVFSPSLALVNGVPAIAYSSSGLGFVRANDVDGSTWGTSISIDTDGNAPISMAMVNGKPSIAYRSNSWELKYVRASDADGLAWGSPILLDPARSECTSLAVVNGVPAVAYVDATMIPASNLKFIQANDADGLSWGTAATLVSGEVGWYTSLVVVAGHPAIVYIGFDSHLKFIRAIDPAGSRWAAPITVASETISVSPSLSVFDGHPAIAYRNRNDGAVELVRALDDSGLSWEASGVTIDSSDFESTPGTDVSFAILASGDAAIAYLQYPTSDLKFAFVQTTPSSPSTSSERLRNISTTNFMHLSTTANDMYVSTTTVSGPALSSSITFEKPVFEQEWFWGAMGAGIALIGLIVPVIIATRRREHAQVVEHHHHHITGTSATELGQISPRTRSRRSSKSGLKSPRRQ